MKDHCLDIGSIQAFLDGELAHQEMARVSGHIAVCDVCALMLADAEDEAAFVFPTLEREFSTLVPTQRLWNRINETIAIEKHERPFWKKAWAFVSIGLMTPSLATAASAVIVLGIVAAFWVNRAPVENDVAGVRPSVSTSAPSAAPGPPVVAPVNIGDTEPTIRGLEKPDSIRFEKASFRTDERRPVRIEGQPLVNSSGYMPGEESYVKTIASLSRSIESSKDSVMRPGERIMFEKDMAVVDDAIAKMRKEVKKNPKNESAKQVLYSSYQNKIDLLNSVSQKEELMASLK